MTLGDRLVFKISVIAEQQTVDESLVGEETDVGASAQQEFCQFWVAGCLFFEFYLIAG